MTTVDRDRGRDGGGRALRGQWALVTGASRGIGFATARALATEGASVALLSRSATALERAAAEIGSRGGHVVALAADVSDVVDAQSAVDAAIRHYRCAPDIVVNSAGLFELAAIADTDPDAFTDALQTNLIGPFAVIRAVLPGMRQRGRGNVVTIGSIADRVIYPENGAYAASKHGLRALHEVLRAELRGSGIRATLVSPGPVDTPLWDEVDPDSREGFTPRAEMLRPEAVADAVLWAVTRPDGVNVDELRLSRS
jgi:NADP-dependent 3-hydroxy acid dehydrogenase YdfG